jgi:hypothetical protein
MKTFTTLLLIFLFATMANAQTNVVLNLEHRLNQSPFVFNATAAAPGGYDFDVTRLEYYISDIEIVHDGGQSTPVSDTWLLVDAGNDVNFDLGSHNVTTIEGIKFYIGIGPDVNNEDPSLWTAGHALAPQNPSMHWGWSSGYRFVAMEGGAGANTSFNYEVHALGNKNYNQVMVMTDAIDNAGDIEIVVYADSARALNNVDVSTGLILHATNGDAVRFLDDFSDNVFFPASALGVNDASFEGSFDLYPNPTSTNSQVSFLVTEGETYNVSVYGMDGKLIQTEQLKSFSGTYMLPELASGAYSVALEQNGSKVVTRKWVVAK